MMLSGVKRSSPGRHETRVMSGCRQRNCWKIYQFFSFRFLFSVCFTAKKTNAPVIFSLSGEHDCSLGDTTITKTNAPVIFSLIFNLFENGEHDCSLGVIADTTIKKKNVLVIFSLIFSLYVSGEHDSLYSSSQFCFSVLICKWRARLYKKNELPPGWLGKHHTQSHTLPITSMLL